MAGVLGWDHGAFAGAFDERPSVEGLEMVVVGAEAVAFVEAGVVGLGPVFAVVELDSLYARAVDPGALRSLGPHRDLLRHRRPTSQG
jgi:hypothetical protein